MDRIQFGRRNLTPDQRRLHLGESYNRRKKSRGGDRRSKGHFVPLNEADTADVIAEEASVNEKTVRRAGSDAEALAAAPELRNAVRAARLPMRDALAADAGCSHDTIDRAAWQAERAAIRDAGNAKRADAAIGNDNASKKNSSCSSGTATESTRGESPSRKAVARNAGIGESSMAKAAARFTSPAKGIRNPGTADRDAVLDWMDREQFGRRNLTPDQRRLSIGRSYNRRKKAAHRPSEEVRQSGGVSAGETADVVADEAGASARSVERYGADAAALDDGPVPELAAAVAAARLPMRDALDALDLDPDVQREIAAVGADGTAERVMIDARAPTGDTP